LPINQNQALFSLLGTTYGGDGRVNFALPDLRGRVPMHVGTGPGLTTRVLGERGGSNAVTLDVADLPAHTHALRAFDGVATANVPTARSTLARSQGGALYGPTGGETALLAKPTVTPAGSTTPHENRQPFMAMRFAIALQGVFPPPP
jgi:microcystin-dependent protein